MKKIIFSIVLATTLFSCKEETRAKVKDAGKAVGSEVKAAAKKTEEKVVKVIDTAKVKRKVNKVIEKSAEAVEKGANAVEKGAKKLKENVKK